MDKENKKFWIECDCACHAIAVDADNFFGSIDLSFWQIGSYTYKYKWLRRLQFAYRMIIHGNVYSDMVSLNKDEANKLIEALKESLEFTKSPEKDKIHNEIG